MIQYHFVCTGSQGNISVRIILLVLTLGIVAAGVVSLLEVKKKNRHVHHRKAIELSDYGIQYFMETQSEMIQKNPRQLSNIEKTTYRGGWYMVDVSVKNEENACTLLIVSEGHSGTETVTQQKEFYFKQKVSGSDTIWILQ